MGYKVVIPTAGTGSRLAGLTKYVNKSLVNVANKPIISHLIEQFPEDCKFVIALGYRGNLVKDFLELVYPDREFYFANVSLYEGKGSGLGLSLLSCEKYLQEPFVFLSCDTLVREKIPKPDRNWMGYATKSDLSQYRTLNITEDIVTKICEKGELGDNLEAYIGLAGVCDFQQFWEEMHSGKEDAVEQGESYGIRPLLENGEVFAHRFTWFDTGNPETIAIARKEYSRSSDPNILEKENEAIWFVGDTVVKYSDDTDFIANRVKRAEELQDFVPDIYASRDNMYCYKRVEGDVLSDVVTPAIFESFLIKCQDFWTEKDLTDRDQERFQASCMKFYKDKTLERVQLFYKNFHQADNAQIVNGEPMPTLQDLLSKINWNWLSQGLPGRFHGDFHFENILYSSERGLFAFLDWRQDFAGDLSIGDVYYDLAKLMHGLIVNHGVIANNQYSASWVDGEIQYSIMHRKKALVECESRFLIWLEEGGYDVKKVKVLTALIYLNIAALHHYPYSILLYGLGKKMLKLELER